MSSPTLTIDLSAIRANYRKIRALAGSARTAAVVKADAYGLGARTIVQDLLTEDCKDFFVAHPEEAFDLPALPPGVRLFILHGPSEGSAANIANAGIIPVLNHEGQRSDYSAYARKLGRKLPVALHIDTGMTRLGFSIADMERLCDNPDAFAPFDVALVMSHLACADLPDDPMNDQQRRAFEKIRARFSNIPASLANSAGCFLGANYHCDLTRPGIALYGGNPIAPRSNPMQEVIQITGKILQTHFVDTPKTVGYGATRLMPKGARIATVAIGYADGYLRALSNTGFAVIDGIHVPVVGRVSMDLITLDISNLAEERAVPGTEVTLLGGGVPVDQLAHQAGTIDYEFLTRLGHRFKRQYIGSIA